MSARRFVPGRVSRALAALVLGASGGVVVMGGTAQAAACSAGTGVTVVVQGQGQNSLGCDANGGGNAASNFGAAGQSMTRTKKFPGFVCRVNGAPASDPCVTASPADAYWGLFWSDGTSGSWVYSSLGVDGLTVPKGGWVAWVFQSSNSRTSPSVTPITRAAAPKPQPKPATGGGSSGSTGSSSGGSSGAGGSTSAPTAKPGASAAKPSAVPSAKAAAKAAAEPGASATPSPSATPSTEAQIEAQIEAREEALQNTSQSTGSSSTLLVGAGLALVLLLGTAFSIWQRRSRQA